MQFLKTKLKACVFLKNWLMCKLPCLLLCTMAMEKTGCTRLAGMWSLFPWLTASVVSSTSLGFWIPGWCFATATIVLSSNARFVPLHKVYPVDLFQDSSVMMVVVGLLHRQWRVRGSVIPGHGRTVGRYDAASG